ncbi:MAG TPA: hypothetical protein VI757_12600, partial [Bacteroidia bacterium]|nr:hypothetical protein [Bacteroidia bacterium]
RIWKLDNLKITATLNPKLFSLTIFVKNISMKHFIQIDDKNKTAKQVLMLLRELSKTNTGVGFISAEEVEDKVLLSLMKQGLRSGLADKKRVLKKLGIE